jgi:hypothetical protein
MFLHCFIMLKTTSYVFYHNDSSAYSRIGKGPHGLKDWQGITHGIKDCERDNGTQNCQTLWIVGPRKWNMWT